MRKWLLVMAFPVIISVPARSSAQEPDANKSLIRNLTSEVIGLIVATPRQDTTSRSILGEAANLQLEFQDFDGFLSSARLIRQMPGSQGQYRAMAHNLVCTLLQSRKIDDAKRYAFAFASGSTEEDDWIRAHLVLRLLNLATAKRDSAKPESFIDSAALRRDALAIARLIRTPEVVTDLQLAFVGYFTRSGDSSNARDALRLADSARHLIGNEDLSRYRAVMIARRAADLGVWPLADTLTAQLWDSHNFGSLVQLQSSKTERGDTSRLSSFNKKLFEHYLEQVKRNPDNRVRDFEFSQLRFRLEYGGRKALADSLSLPLATKRSYPVEQPRESENHDMRMIRAVESIQKGNTDETERLFRAVPDPDHNGMPARTMIDMADNAHPDNASTLKQRGLAMLLHDSHLRPRDQVLSEFARDRLQSYGDNEMAIDIVNQIRDVKLARDALANIGESVYAKLDPPKLRKLVDRIRSREVKDQVLFRLMTSMLLTIHASAHDHAWGLAIADSITTPDLRSRAMIEVGKFYWSHGDTTRARTVFLERLRNGIENENTYDKYTVLTVLLGANASGAVVSWARAKRDPIDKARALLWVAHLLSAQLYRESVTRGFLVSTEGDACRADF